jgi:hypothetical protein
VKIDDIAADLVARNASFVTALSTVPIPLAPLTSENIYTRNYREPWGKVCVFIDTQPEEYEEIAPTFSIMTLSVEITIFTLGNTETVLREQAAKYRQAIVNCLKLNPYFFSIVSAEDFDGVEGKADTKASRVVLEFKYEET